MLKIVVYVSLR